MTRTIPGDDDDAIDAAAQALRDGELVVAATDTVYAVLADAFHDAGTARLRAVRGTAEDAPWTAVVRSHKQLPGLVPRLPEVAERLVAAFWPGPLTLILPASETIAVDLGATDGAIAVRWPADERLAELVAAVGPLASSAACPVGRDAPTEVAAAEEALGDDVAVYLDGGPTPGGRSTVVDCARGGAEVRRRGLISADAVLDAASGATGWGAPTGDA